MDLTSSGNIKTYAKNHWVAFVGCGTAILVVGIIAILAYRKLMEIRNSKSGMKRKRYNVDEDDFEYTVEEKEERALYGWLCSRVMYKPEDRCLRVEKIQCTSLYSPEGYYLNSFIKVRIEPRRWNIPEFVTVVFPNSNDPAFKSAFKFKLPLKKLKHAILIWEIFDKNLTNGKTVSVGIVKLTLGNLDSKTFFNIHKEVRLRICEDKKMKEGNGDICIVLKNSPLQGKFTVTVLEAKNLNLKPTKGYPPVFVTVSYYHEKRRLESRSTNIMHNTNCPYFMESFTFALKIGNTENSSVMVKVWKRLLVGMEKCIGSVDLGFFSESISGKRHWDEMVANPRKAVALWHPL